MRLISIFIIIIASLKSTHAGQLKENNLVYVSIGNQRYSNLLSGNKIFYDNDGALLSAQCVDSLLSHFGEGTLLSSNENHYISKNEIISTIEDAFYKAMQIENSVLVIYYCGHGLSDSAGSSYIIPGDNSNIHNEIVSVDEIKIHMLGMMNRYYYGKLRASKPFVLFLFDCCQTIDDIPLSTAYKKLIGKMNERMDAAILNSEDLESLAISFGLKYFLNKGDMNYSAYLEAIKDECKYYHFSTVFSTKFGHDDTLTDMSDYNSYAKKTIKSVGSICRRMLYYFEQITSDSIRLSDFNRFLLYATDSRTHPYYVEKEMTHMESYLGNANGLNLITGLTMLGRARQIYTNSHDYTAAMFVKHKRKPELIDLIYRPEIK